MSSVAQRHRRPRALNWTAALLAPFAWCLALGLMFSLIDGTCATGSRIMLWACAAICVALAAAPAAILGHRRRLLDPDPEDRFHTRLVLDLAVAGSVILALVMVATAVPILSQNACGA